VEALTMSDIEDRLERLESLVDRQQERIDQQQETIREQRDRIRELETEPTENVEDGSTTLDRRDALKAGGLLALLFGGVGTASANPQGQVGTSSDPLQALYTAELNGPLTDGNPLDSLLGSGLTIQDGNLTTVTDVAELAVTSFAVTDKELTDTFSVDVDVEETAGVQTDTLRVTLEVVGSGRTTIYEETYSPNELTGESTTVTFGSDGDTAKLGPFDPGDYTVTVTAEAVNAASATATDSFVVPNPFAGGSGTEDDPYRIETWTQLDAVRDQKASAFVLDGDLNESTTGYDHVASASANGGEGFRPIGRDTDPDSGEYEGTPFTGSFDGNGHTISGLTIDTGSLQYLGLFGKLSNASVSDLSLEAVEITCRERDEIASQYTAGLAAENESGTIERASVAGNINSRGGALVAGGLVGQNTGEIVESSASGTFTGDISSSTGGLVGRNEGKISNSSASGRVKNGRYVGGLVGLDRGTVTNSSADATVSSTGNFTQYGSNYAAGLVGFNEKGTVEDSHAVVEVKMTKPPDTFDTARGAGFVGRNEATVKRSYATGSVRARGTTGGLVGINSSSGTVTDSYATSSTTSDALAGGLAGANEGSISNSYAVGDANASGTEAHTGGIAGGLVADNTGTVEQSYATGTVSGEYHEGGLVGRDSYDSGTVASSYWDTASTGQLNSVGGGTGLTTGQMQGLEAQNNMSDLDFSTVWATVDAENDVDISADDYPVLQALDRATQLEVRG